MGFLDLFKNLLPKALAWNIVPKKALRTFFESLVVLPDDFKNFADKTIYLDFYSDTTTLIPTWNKEYGLNAGLLTEQEQRDRIKTLRSVDRGQAALTLQNYLQAYGFDVYVYDSYDSGNPIYTGSDVGYTGRPEILTKNKWLIKNPFDYLRPTFLPTSSYTTMTGNPTMYTGRPEAITGAINESPYYPLVNKIPIRVPKYSIYTGGPASFTGRPEAITGEYEKTINTYKDYIIPNDPDVFPYFVYIAGNQFPTPAEVLFSRKDEFENLCLKICPTQDWLGIIVDYV